MSGFELIDPKDYSGILLRNIPELLTSKQFQSLEEEDRRRAGLVFSAFAAFMEELERDSPLFGKCLDTIEAVAAIGEAEADNLLVTEVYEAWSNPAALLSHLHSRSRALYESWMI